MLLALDLGTTFGWALETKHGLQHGFNKLSKRKDTHLDRFIAFRDWLERRGSVSEVVYEEVTFKHVSLNAAIMYHGLRAVLLLWCYDNGVPCHGVPVGTLKKGATGRGNASKGDMTTKAKELTGEPIRDDNEADAICLFYVFKNMVG